MNEHLKTLKNFVIESINNPDKIIDDINIVTEDYKMTISGKSQNGYTVSYITNSEFTTLSMASKLSKVYRKNPLIISNKIDNRPKNIIILGAWSISPIHYKNCVFLCNDAFESISICEDCLFTG